MSRPTSSPAARTAVVCGLGADLPPRVVGNEQLCRELDTTDEWIVSRTGIRTRRHADPGTATSDLAVAAGQRALKSAGRAGVGVVVLATTTPDMACPATAPSVADRLGLGAVAAFDVSAVCSGFVYALAVASSMIVAGLAEDALVIAAETFSTLLDPSDRGTAVIFGDGAGAVVLRAGDANEPGSLGPFELGSDGSGRDLITVPGRGSRERLAPDAAKPGDRYFAMAGKPVFRHAVRAMTESSLAVLRRAGLEVAAIDRVVCHQANARILAQLSHNLGIDSACFPSNIEHVGNTAGASIPLALEDAVRTGELRAGHTVLLTAFGGGLSWGATVLTWPDLVLC